MPEIGERKTKNGVTGEWDGTTWRQINSEVAGPAVGTRKTKGGITGEWDGTTWRQVEADAAPRGSSGLGEAGVLAGMIPAAVAGGKRLAEHVATSPMTAKATGAVAKMVRKASPLALGYQLMHGDVRGALATGATTLAAKYGPQAVQYLAGRAATALPASPAASGAGVGLALPAALLMAIEHDANRQPQIDPEKNPIMRGFLTMAGQR